MDTHIFSIGGNHWGAWLLWDFWCLFFPGLFLFSLIVVIVAAGCMWKRRRELGDARWAELGKSLLLLTAQFALAALIRDAGASSAAVPVATAQKDEAATSCLTFCRLLPAAVLGLVVTGYFSNYYVLHDPPATMAINARAVKLNYRLPWRVRTVPLTSIAAAQVEPEQGDFFQRESRANCYDLIIQLKNGRAIRIRSDGPESQTPAAGAEISRLIEERGGIASSVNVPGSSLHGVR